MLKINRKQLALSLAVTSVFLYLACVLLMAIAGSNGTIWIFNSLLHGLDTTSIININISIIQSLFGLLFTFIIAWLIGFIIATIYNLKINE